LLALLVAAFVATWLTIPAKGAKKADPPAAFFAHGLCHSSAALATASGPWRLTPGQIQCAPQRTVDVHDLKRRVIVVYAGAAVIVLLLGLAFGAARRA